MITANTNTLHGNALRLGEFGILITGQSDSGKSTVTLALIERAQANGRSASFVADDYVELAIEDGALFAYVPEAIKGAIEIRGAGLFKMDYQKKVRLDLVVELQDEGERYPADQKFTWGGLSLPCLKLPRLQNTGALTVCHAIEATLFKTRWEPEG